MRMDQTKLIEKYTKKVQVSKPGQEDRTWVTVNWVLGTLVTGFIVYVWFATQNIF